MEQIIRLRDRFVAVWEAAAPGATFEGPTRPLSERRRNESALARFVDLLAHEARGARRDDVRRELAERRVLAAFAAFATTVLEWDPHSLDTAVGDGFRHALRTFPAQARRFDPALPASDIYQAARNALTMFCLQSLLGRPVELTPAVLGYSLLYPYTDNLLDDPQLDAESKQAFGCRLRLRLRGAAARPVGVRESRIFDLVSMIEGHCPRARNPRVFESLVAIHDAQVRSLALLAGPAPPDRRTLVEIAVEKGGASVLADGYLVADALTPQQAECIFGLGVFLQLRDDLEDVNEDRAAGVATAFSARAGSLDDPTARALAVGAAVLRLLPCFDSPRAAPLRDIMARSLPLVIPDAAASFPALFSPAYLAALERRSPFRFACLARQRRRLSRANGSLSSLLEYWIAEGDDGTRPAPRLTPAPADAFRAAWQG